MKKQESHWNFTIFPHHVFKHVVWTQPKHPLYVGTPVLPKGYPTFCAKNQKHRFCASCSLVSDHIRFPPLVSWGNLVISPDRAVREGVSTARRVSLVFRVQFTLASPNPALPC